MKTTPEQRTDVKTAEEILESNDTDKNPPHWVTKKAAIKSMHEFSNQKNKRIEELELAVGKAIDFLNGSSKWTVEQVYNLLIETRDKKP